MRLHLEHVLSQPVQRVFPYLADPANRPEWQAAVARVEVLDAGPPHPGMRWKETTRGAGVFDMQIVEMEADRVWAEHATSDRAEMTLTLRFSPEGGGTRLSVVADLDLKGWRRVGGPVVKATMPPMIRADLRRVDRIVAARWEKPV